MVTPVSFQRQLPSLLDMPTPIKQESTQEELNPTVLCSVISDSDTTAFEIAVMSDDFLPMFTQYTEKELFEICEPVIAFYPEKKQKKIRKTISNLYSISLVNSRFNSIAKEVETNIVEYLVLTKKERFQSLIDEATKALEGIPKDNKEIGEQINSLQTLRNQITELLMLFSYIELGNKERIENLIEKTEQFPKSRFRFHEFCQNLEICQNERLCLIQKQNALHRKIEELKKIVTALAVQIAPKILGFEQNALYQTFDKSFWEAGVDLFTDAFVSTLKTGRKKGCLPELFIEGVKRASKIKDFLHLTLPKCFNKNGKDFPEQYVHEVWSHFVKDKTERDDTSDFMQYVLSKIPQQSFLDLREKLKTSKSSKDTIQRHVREYLYTQTKGDLTFMGLKSWYTK